MSWVTAAPGGSVAPSGPSPTPTSAPLPAPTPNIEKDPNQTTGGSVDPGQANANDAAPPSDVDPSNSNPPNNPATADPNGGSDPHPQSQASSTDSLPNTGDTDTEIPAAEPQPQPNKDPKMNIEKHPVYLVDGQTIAPGGPAATISGVRYSLDPSATAFMSNSKTIALQAQANNLPDIPIGQQTFTANEASQYIIGAQTLGPGGPPITVSGTRYSLAPSATALVAGSSTIALTPPQPIPPALSINGKTYSADSRPRVNIGTAQVVAGGPTVTINQTPYALDASGTALRVGSSSTIPVDALPTARPQSPTPDDQTPSGIPLVIGTQTTFIPQRNSPNAAANAVVITLNSTPYTLTPASSSLFLVASQTLTPGSPAITINGTPISLPPSSPTTSLSPTITQNPNFALLTLDNNQTYTCYQSSACVIANQTLTPNGTITVGAET
ncbi:MAG: hypothetical protein Q9222_006234, partial [Ikaeria aurantiellina]